MNVNSTFGSRDRLWSCTHGALLLTVASAAVGCGSGVSQYDLSGSVTFRGQPVATGTIVFEPSAAHRNHGPPGFAKITAGQYDTRQPDCRGIIGGPHVVRIIGLDGIAQGELVNGLPLFPEYVVPVDFLRENSKRDFDVHLDKARGPTRPQAARRSSWLPLRYASVE